MTSVTKVYKRIRGLMLAQDPSGSEDLYVVSGRNFMPRLEGPETWFASEYVTMDRPNYGEYVELFRHTGQSIIISENGVWTVDENCRIRECFKITCHEEQSCAEDFCYPWTHAFVGETHYYSHPKVGIIAFDTFTNEWRQLPRKALGFSSLIFGITEANNSLIVLGRDTVTWSAFDEGDCLIEDEYNGVGSQNLHLAENGRPLGVYSDGIGFFTFTTNGIMYSSPMSSAQVISGEQVESMAVFQHRTFDTDEFTEVPLSPCAIRRVNRSRIAFVSNKGIFQIGRFDNNQFAMQPLDQTFNRWMREDLFKCFAQNVCCNIKLTYDGQENWLFVSVDRNGDYSYKEAFVYDFELEEWGHFGQRHVTIGEVNFDGASERSLGFVSSNRRIRKFTNNGFNEIKTGISNESEVHNSWIKIGVLTTLTEEGDAEFMSEINRVVIDTKCHPTNEFDVTLDSGIGPCFWQNGNGTCENLYLQETRECTRHYSCSNQGLYHILTVTANAPYGYFALRQIRVTTRKKGRL